MRWASQRSGALAADALPDRLVVVVVPGAGEPGRAGQRRVELVAHRHRGVQVEGAGLGGAVQRDEHRHLHGAGRVVGGVGVPGPGGRRRRAAPTYAETVPGTLSRWASSSSQVMRLTVADRRRGGGAGASVVPCGDDGCRLRRARRLVRGVRHRHLQRLHDPGPWPAARPAGRGPRPLPRPVLRHRAPGGGAAPAGLAAGRGRPVRRAAAARPAAPAGGPRRRGGAAGGRRLGAGGGVRAGPHRRARLPGGDRRGGAGARARWAVRARGGAPVFRRGVRRPLRSGADRDRRRVRRAGAQLPGLVAARGAGAGRRLARPAGRPAQRGHRRRPDAGPHGRGRLSARCPTCSPSSPPAPPDARAA